MAGNRIVWRFSSSVYYRRANSIPVLCERHKELLGSRQPVCGVKTVSTERFPPKLTRALKRVISKAKAGKIAEELQTSALLSGLSEAGSKTEDPEAKVFETDGVDKSRNGKRSKKRDIAALSDAPRSLEKLKQKKVNARTLKRLKAAERESKPTPFDGEEKLTSSSKSLKFLLGSRSVDLEGAKVAAFGDSPRGISLSRRMFLNDTGLNALWEEFRTANNDSGESDDVEDFLKFDMHGALAGRYAGPVDHPATAELVTHLQAHHNLYAKDLHMYQCVPPSVLGTEPADVEAMRSNLERAGFNQKEVDILLPIFPPFLQVDFHSVFRVFLHLKQSYSFNHKFFCGLLQRSPFVFTLSVEQIETRLSVLKELGLASREIATLLIKTPVLLYMPLSDEALTTLREAKGAGLSSRWICKTLLQNFKFRPAKVPFSCHSKQLAALLSHFHIDMADLSGKYPELFTHSRECVEAVVQCLSGAPLYLTMQNVRHLIIRVPHLFFAITDIAGLQEHARLLCDLIGSPDGVRWTLLPVPSLISPAVDVRGKCDLLQGSGFTASEVSALVQSSPSLLVQNTTDEFAPRLRLLLDVRGMKPSDVITSARLYMQTPLPMLQGRIQFATAHKADLLEAERMEDLVGAGDEEFAELCGQSLSVYQREVGREFRRKRGRPPQRKLNKEVADSTQDTDDPVVVDGVSRPFLVPDHHSAARPIPEEDGDGMAAIEVDEPVLETGFNSGTIVAISGDENRLSAISKAELDCLSKEIQEDKSSLEDDKTEETIDLDRSAFKPFRYQVSGDLIPEFELTSYLEALAKEDFKTDSKVDPREGERAGSMDDYFEEGIHCDIFDDSEVFLEQVQQV